jgi:hypothetical protein
MPIPREYATSNPVVRDALAAMPLPQTGTKVGDFVSPDFPVDAETVDLVITAEHALNLDDLRAPDAEAKQIRFETGTTATRTVVEHALKSKIDSRKLDEAGTRGVDILAQRSDLLRQDIMDAKEYRIATLALTAGNYAAGHKDVTGLNFRTIDLFATVEGWRNTILADGRFDPKKAVIGRAAWAAARRNAGFNSYVAGSAIKAGGRDLTMAAFADYLGLDEVRLGDFQRLIGNAATPTQFWTTDSFLLFAQNNSLSNRTFMITPVVPYGEHQGAASGTLVDVRTEPLPGTERMTEFGVYHRYRSTIANASLAFLATGIVAT